MGQPGLFLFIFVLFINRKDDVFRGIRTRTVWVEGEHADHLITTTMFVSLGPSCNLLPQNTWYKRRPNLCPSRRSRKISYPNFLFRIFKWLGPIISIPKCGDLTRRRIGIGTEPGWTDRIFWREMARRELSGLLTKTTIWYSKHSITILAKFNSFHGALFCRNRRLVSAQVVSCCVC